MLKRTLIFFIVSLALLASNSYSQDETPTRQEQCDLYGGYTDSNGEFQVCYESDANPEDDPTEDEIYDNVEAEDQSE